MCETAICSITKAEADQEVEQFSKAFIEFAAKVIDNSPHAKSVLFIQSSGNNGDITWKNSNELLTADYNGFFATAISYKFSDPELIFLQAKVASHVLIVGASTYSQASANYTMLPSHDTERSGLLAGAFILAPGGGSEKPIYSALLPSGGGRSRYGYMYGTSMAAPHVSGVAALVMQANPELSAQEVREVLLKAADNNLGTAYKDHPNAGDGYDGYRYLNAEAAVKMALAMKAQKNCGSITSPSVVAQQGPSYTVTAGQSTRFTATARPKDGYPFNSYRWKTSEGVEVLSTIEQANITFTTAGSGSVTVTPVLQDGTVCTLSAATSSVTVQGAGFTNPANGHSYELITCGTWSQCRVAAIAKGGSLVTIRNQAENDWLYATFGVPEPFWLGAYYDQTVGAWKWASGEPFQYSSWGNNLNNSGGDEFCSQTFISTPGFWNDVRCNYPYSTKAIIEYPSGVALGGGTVTVLANTIPGATVTVPSGASSCSFVSTGTWSAGPQAPPQYQNADGVIGGTSYNLTNFGVPMPGEGNMALVVKHSSTGNWDLLGSSRTISVVAGETLSFMMNDATTFGYTDGNTGQLSTVWSCN